MSDLTRCLPTGLDSVFPVTAFGGGGTMYAPPGSTLPNGATTAEITISSVYFTFARRLTQEREFDKLRRNSRDWLSIQIVIFSVPARS